MGFKNFVRLEGYPRQGARAHILHVTRIKAKAPGPPIVIEGPTNQEELAEKLQGYADQGWESLARKQKKSHVLQEIVLSAPRGTITREELARWAKELADHQGITERVILIHEDESQPHAHIIFPRLKRWNKQDIYRLQEDAIQIGRELGIQVSKSNRGRKRIPFRAYMASSPQELPQASPQTPKRQYRWAEVLARVNQLDFVGLCRLLERLGYIPPKPQGRTILLRCPWREDNTPSLSWFKSPSDHKWRWKDHGTGEAGDIVDFLRKAQGLDYSQATIALETALQGLPTHEPSKEDIIEHFPTFDPQPAREIWKRARNPRPRALAHWLTRHGFPKEVAEVLAADELLRKHIGLYQGSLVVPYYKEGKPCGISRRTPKGQKRDKGLKTIGFIPGYRDIWVVEGIRDALSVYALHLFEGARPPTIAIIGGSPSGWGLKELVRTIQTISPRKVFIALDNDDAGREMSELIGRVLARNGLKPFEQYESIIPVAGKDWHEELILAYKEKTLAPKPSLSR